jgi:hypothetical protein
VFVSIKGSAYARVRRALETDSASLPTAAAYELPQLNLADALRLCLVYARADRLRRAPPCMNDRVSSKYATPTAAGASASSRRRVRGLAPLRSRRMSLPSRGYLRRKAGPYPPPAETCEWLRWPERLAEA